MYLRKNGVVRREIAGETFLVPVAGKIASLKRVFILNEVAGVVWESLARPSELEDLVASVVKAFAVEPGTARADVAELLGALEENGLLEPVP